MNDFYHICRVFILYFLLVPFSVVFSILTIDSDITIIIIYYYYYCCLHGIEPKAIGLLESAKPLNYIPGPASSIINVSFLKIFCTQVFEILYFFFFSLFLLWCSKLSKFIRYFYWLSNALTDSIFCHLCSTIEPIWWVYFSDYILSSLISIFLFSSFYSYYISAKIF